MRRIDALADHAPAAHADPFSVAAADARQPACELRAVFLFQKFEPAAIPCGSQHRPVGARDNERPVIVRNIGEIAVALYFLRRRPVFSVAGSRKRLFRIDSDEDRNALEIKARRDADDRLRERLVLDKPPLRVIVRKTDARFADQDERVADGRPVVQNRRDERPFF